MGEVRRDLTSSWEEMYELQKEVVALKMDNDRQRKEIIDLRSLRAAKAERDAAEAAHEASAEPLERARAERKKRARAVHDAARC